jgi:LysR family transcriptional regulator, benzoate and cis,cis-muconate-responsive activator of ben and cat genes
MVSDGKRRRRGSGAGARRDPKLVDMAIIPGQKVAGVRSGGVGQRLNLNRLRYFVTIAQELHFGRAARKLGISQPPLSLHIKALEQQVGSPLFIRANRQVTLTAAGRILLNQAQRLLDHAQRVDDIMQGVGSGELGEMFIGCVPSAMYDVLPRILAPFRARYPNVHVVLKEGHTMDVMNAVQEGQLDVGLVWRSMAGGPSLGMQPILSEKFAALVPIHHPLANKRVLSLDVLASQPLILPPRKISPYHYDHIIAAFAKLGLTPRIEYEVPTILSQIGFVASGFGIAISPSFAKRFMTGQIALIPIAEEMPRVILSLVWNEARQSPIVDLFRQLAGETYDSKKLGL